MATILVAPPDFGEPDDYIIEAVKCFLCDHNFLEGEEPWLMFEKRVQEDGQLECALSAILASALGRELQEEAAHSKLLCDACNATVLEFESIEQRFYEMRFRILTEYNKTAKRNDLAQIAIEINGILQETAMEDEVEVAKIVEQSEVTTDSPNNVLIVPKLEAAKQLSKLLPAVKQEDLVIEDNVDARDDDIESNLTVVDNSDYDHFELLTASKAKLDYETVKEEEVAVDNIIDVEDVEIDEDIIYDEIIEHSSQISNVDEASADSQYMENYQSSSSNNNTIDMIYANVEEETNVAGEENTAYFVSKRRFSRVPRQLKETDPPIYEQEGHIYRCLLCPATVDYDPSSFEEHMRAVHNYRFYTCDLCGSGFSRRQLLNDHMDSYHGAGEHGHYECETCQRVFNNYRLFRIHKRMHHSNIKQFECTECNKKYGSKNLLDEHMNMHTGERPYKCMHCSKDFASKYTLHAHLKIHSDRQRPYQCDICDKAFLNQQNLTQHRKLHSGIKSFVCDVCAKAFGTQHNLDVHKIVHSGQKPFICRTCGKAFARRAEIKDHERIHTGERPFKCDLCNMAFAQRSNLTSHKKSTHFNEKQHQCQHCERSFKRRRLLDYHVQSTHTGERPHKCEMCGATFVYPEHHKKHMRIHMGIKPYACEVCGKQFNSRDNRNAHRFIHSDKKPYECLECGAGFMRKPLLLAHMKHTKHSNDTIIVNQPQIGVRIGARIAFDGDEQQEQIDEDDDMVEEVDEHLPSDETKEDAEVDVDVDNDDMVESYQQMMQRAESLLADVDNECENSNDAITNVAGQLIKDESGDVQYLQFEELDGDGHQTLTWVIP